MHTHSLIFAMVMTALGFAWRVYKAKPEPVTFETRKVLSEKTSVFTFKCESKNIIHQEFTGYNYLRALITISKEEIEELSKILHPGGYYLNEKEIEFTNIGEVILLYLDANMNYSHCFLNFNYK